jgi:DNA protecting protein DprA
MVWRCVARARDRTGLTAARAFELCRTLGGPARADGVAETLCAGLGAALAARVREAAALAGREREQAARAGETYLGRCGLSGTAADHRGSTAALFVRAPGDLEHAVAVVGAPAGEAGRRTAGTLARELAQAGIVVVSGLATGIDGAAHQGALDGGGRTVAVMATGIDDVYPSWHRALAEQIASSGALVTEFPAGTAALPRHFPQRNRIVSGLAMAVIVIEAAEGSGSLITARYALDQGREVFAVPGPIGDGRHRGSHRLLQQGAALVTGGDVLALAPLRARLAGERTRTGGALSDEERRI